MTEISIEGKFITPHTIHIEFFEENREESITRPLKVLEDWLTENNYLDWHQIVMQNNEHVADRDGTWEFSTFVAEKLNDEILEKFVRHELKLET